MADVSDNGDMPFNYKAIQPRREKLGLTQQQCADADMRRVAVFAWMWSRFVAREDGALTAEQMERTLDVFDELGARVVCWGAWKDWRPLVGLLQRKAVG